MTFLERLQANPNSLLRLKTSLYWYNISRLDDKPERICLILNVGEARSFSPDQMIAFEATCEMGFNTEIIGVRLLVDGSPKWVWVDELSTELIISEPI